MIEFKTARMDKKTKLLTIIFVVFFLIFPVFTFFLKPINTAVSIFILILLYGIIFLAFANKPQKIILTPDNLQIKTILNKEKINFNTVNKVEKYLKIKFNIRTFGIGGLFGYFGYFNGNDIWYVTNINKKVKITLKNGQIYMISPENPDEFLSQINYKLIK